MSNVNTRLGNAYAKPIAKKNIRIILGLIAPKC